MSLLHHKFMQGRLSGGLLAVTIGESAGKIEIREEQDKERVEKCLVTEKGRSVTLVGWIIVRNYCVIM